ncbi:Tol-Pal system beta propeller repeat protein TolB [Thiobacter sp. AK1]|uniref:Tol-Pal system protein TolB n=2 Tax=Thiobacter aerophilum TaxID=3121275 RepID=A0ABV0EFM0_9BURK
MTELRLSRLLIRLIGLFVAAWLSTAQAALTIEITGGAALQIPVAIAPFQGEEAWRDRLSGIIAADLARSGQFKIVSTAGVTPLPRQPADVKLADWKARGAAALVIGNVVSQPGGRLDVQFRLLSTIKEDPASPGGVQQLAGFSLPSSPTQLRLTAHQIADIIYEKLTGDLGVFATRIAYVTKRGGLYELQVADSDGVNAQTVFSSREPIMSPAWSPDGTRLAYVAFESKKPVIYVQELATARRFVLANFKGSNSAPAWAPDGRQLAIVLTKDGTSQIYAINADGTGLKRLTHSSAIDTEPSWSPDGRYILFTSDRGGSPQIYRMPAYGGEPVRLTFQGSYNVTPRYSPDGKSFVFIQREGGRFRVAMQEIASGQVQILTDNQLDESPSFAPNGKLILYASEQGGRGVLAAVSSDGRVKQKLTTEAGDVREPAWGPRLKSQP